MRKFSRLAIMQLQLKVLHKLYCGNLRSALLICYIYEEKG